MKLSIIIGHTLKGKDRGAVAYNGMTESEYNYKVANLLKEINGINVKIWLRDGTTYKKMSSEIKAFNPNVHMELHFNSFSKAAYGCECLALSNDNRSIAFADLVTDVISDVLEIKERHSSDIVDGVLRIGVGGRGHLNLQIIRDALNPMTPVVLLEPFFANIKTSESQKFLEQPELYARALAASVLRWGSSHQESKGVDSTKYKMSPETTMGMIKGLLKKGYGL